MQPVPHAAGFPGAVVEEEPAVEGILADQPDSGSLERRLLVRDAACWFKEMDVSGEATSRHVRTRQ